MSASRPCCRYRAQGRRRRKRCLPKREAPAPPPPLPSEVWTRPPFRFLSQSSVSPLTAGHDALLEIFQRLVTHPLGARGTRWSSFSRTVPECLRLPNVLI